ncbi:MAG: fumarylacetoacetase [Rhodothermales bacterium]
MPASWIPIPADSDFSLHNLPFGIFSAPGRLPGAGVAIGDQILDLAAAASAGLFEGLTLDASVFRQPSLNAFIWLGKGMTNAVRDRIAATLVDPDSPLRGSRALVAQSDATMHLPVEIGDYTDFYSSIDHATNVGKMFRDPDHALLPNWRHIPVGYHGRASSIVVSGTPIRRPWGQVLPPAAESPIFKPTGRLDFELEVAFVIGKDSDLGDPVPLHDAEAYIFGLVLFNDWSARDIQKWEYVPLGPFLAKNFGSSMSPWVVPLEALEAFRIAGPIQEPAVLPYLRSEHPGHFDIPLEVSLTPEDGPETVVSRSNFRHLYWSMAQQLAHHTVNGCNVRVGDVLASGTISGPDAGAYGSMLELAWGGSKPLSLAGGASRAFIEDGDTVTLRGQARKGVITVGFGEVQTRILPAR